MRPVRVTRLLEFLLKGREFSLVLGSRQFSLEKRGGPRWLQVAELGLSMRHGGCSETVVVMNFGASPIQHPVFSPKTRSQLSLS